MIHDALQHRHYVGLAQSWLVLDIVSRTSASSVLIVKLTVEFQQCSACICSVWHANSSDDDFDHSKVQHDHDF